MSQASVVTCRPYLAFASTVQRRARTNPPAPAHTRTPKKNQNEPLTYLPRVINYPYMEQVLKQYWVVSFAAIDPPAVLLVPTTYLRTVRVFFFFFRAFSEQTYLQPSDYLSVTAAGDNLVATVTAGDLSKW